jgi:hypothetical protein
VGDSWEKPFLIPLRHHAGQFLGETMQCKNLCLTALAASAVLVGTHAADADVLANYDFSEFTQAQTDAYTNVSRFVAGNGHRA